MEKIHLYSEIIDNAVEIVAVLDFSSPAISFNYDDYIKKIEKANRTLNDVHLSEIEEDIWECNKQFSSYSETLSYVNTFFRNLFEWKEGINTIEQVIDEVNKDMFLFHVKYSSVKSLSNQKSSLRKIYSTIAIHLQQFKLEYIKICKRLIDRVKATEEQKELPTSISSAYNFRLNPDYADTAANYLNAAIDKGWFSVVDQKKQLLKVDILIALGYMFGCPIPDIAPDQNPLLQTTEALCSTAPVSEPAAIATNSLAAHLLHTQPALLAERIKTVFNIEKGKSIRLLIKALEENQPALITVANRNFKAVYLALKETLGRDIGSYQSVMGYKYNSTADQPDYDAICQKLTHILTTLESGQIS